MTILRLSTSALLLGLIAGCGQSPATSSPTPSPTPAASPTPSPSPTPTPTRSAFTIAAKGPLKVGTGMAKPKVQLRFGQKAVVPVEFYDEETAVGTRGVVSFVVQAPRKAPAGVVAALPADSRPGKGQVVYYAPVVVTNESDVDLEGFPGPMLVAKLRSGRETGYQIGAGGVAECDPHGQALQLAELGASDRTCVIAVASAKDPLGQVQYVDPPYGYDNRRIGDEPDHNDFYDLGAITWR